jgi:hypothetical protein
VYSQGSSCRPRGFHIPKQEQKAHLDEHDLQEDAAAGAHHAVGLPGSLSRGVVIGKLATGSLCVRRVGGVEQCECLRAAAAVVPGLYRPWRCPAGALQQQSRCTASGPIVNGRVKQCERLHTAAAVMPGLHHPQRHPAADKADDLLLGWQESQYSRRAMCGCCMRLPHTQSHSTAAAKSHFRKDASCLFGRCFLPQVDASGHALCLADDAS